MQVYHPQEIKQQLFVPGPVVTIGVFDGVHRGHQSLLDQVINWSQQLHSQAVVITFDAHPMKVLGKKAPMMITSLEQRLALLSSYGIDSTVVIPFDQEWTRLPASDFVRLFLKEKLNIQGIVVGFDFRFGYQGQGNEKLLRKMGAQLGFSVRLQEPLFAGPEQLISSTAIRRAILDGKLDTAAQMLGRPFSLRGTVVTGMGRGRRLGFPTANLRLHHTLKPPCGVYYCNVRWQGKLYPALTNIGWAPTFGSHTEQVEVHLLDFCGDLYQQVLEVDVLEKIRDEKKFASAAQLRQQLELDKAAVLMKSAASLPSLPPKFLKKNS